MNEAVLSFSFAGLLCQIITDDEHLSQFLKKKYRLFLLKKDKLQKNSLKFYLTSKSKKTPKTKIECVIPSLKGKIYITDLRDLTRRFRTFNGILQSAFGTYLLFNKGFLLHASAFLINNKAHIFSGKIGVGKSTIIKLHPHRLPLNDDAAIVRKIGNQFWAYASPFYEKGRTPKSEGKYKIKGVYFIKQGNQNRLNRLKDEKAILIKLLANTYCLWIDSLESSGERPSLLDLMSGIHLQFRRKFPFYELDFSKEKNFFDKLLLQERNLKKDG